MRKYVFLEKINVLCFVFLATFGIVLAADNQPKFQIGQPVYPLTMDNRAEYNGGICYANATLQCLLQNHSFCQYLDLFQPTVSSDQSLKNLKALRQRLVTGAYEHQHYYDAQECCWNVVKAFAQETKFHGSDPVPFIYYLLNLLCKGNVESFFYSDEHKIVERAVIGMNGDSRSLNVNYHIDGRTKKPTSVVPCNDLKTIEQDLCFICIPNLRILMVASWGDGIEDRRIFAKLATQMQNQLSLLWSGKTGYTITLFGVVAAVDNRMGDQRGHAIAYTLHKGNWIYCNDYHAIQNVGHNFVALNNHIYNVQKGAPMVLFFNVNDNQPGPHNQSMSSTSTYDEDIQRALKESLQQELERKTKMQQEEARALAFALQQSFDEKNAHDKNLKQDLDLDRAIALSLADQYR